MIRQIPEDGKGRELLKILSIKKMTISVAVVSVTLVGFVIKGNKENDINMFKKSST